MFCSFRHTGKLLANQISNRFFRRNLEYELAFLTRYYISYVEPGANFQVGFDSQGRLLAADIALYQNAGYSQDVSVAVSAPGVMIYSNCCQ
jgi:hypothetical protein